VDGYRIYFRISWKESQGLRRDCYCGYLGPDAEYASLGNNIIIEGGCIAMNIEVGCGGVYLLFDQYYAPHDVLFTHIGTSCIRRNKYFHADGKGGVGGVGGYGTGCSRGTGGAVGRDGGTKGTEGGRDRGTKETVSAPSGKSFA